MNKEWQGFSHAERIGALEKRYVDMISSFSHSAMNKILYTHHLNHILH